MVVLYGVLSVLQPLLLLAIGALSIGLAGIPFELLLLVGLAYGRPLAWGILIFLDTVALIAIVGAILAGGGHLEVLHAAVALLTTAALEAALLSAPMRRHVQSRGLALRRRKGSLSSSAAG